MLVLYDQQKDSEKAEPPTDLTGDAYMSDEVKEILASSKLFKGFTSKQLDEVIEHLGPKQIKIKSGDRIYKRGSVADSCWLIKSGKLTVKRSSLRTPFRSLIYHKGSVTGIQGLADPGSKRVVSMIADGKVELVEITHEGTNKLNNDTQIMLWKNVSKVLLRKLSISLSRETLD